MESRNTHERRGHQQHDESRFRTASNNSSDQQNSRNRSRMEREPASDQRRSDARRIIWENDLYERQSF